MISTAGYYCTRGHVWEVTTNTFDHDSIPKRPCPECIRGDSAAIGSVRGPFSSEAAARHVMEFRTRDMISGEQETYESLAAKRDHHEDMVKAYNRRIDALLRESREREEGQESHPRYLCSTCHYTERIETITPACPSCGSSAGWAPA